MKTFTRNFKTFQLIPDNTLTRLARCGNEVTLPVNAQINFYFNLICQVMIITSGYLCHGFLTIFSDLSLFDIICITCKKTNICTVTVHLKLIQAEQSQPFCFFIYSLSLFFLNELQPTWINIKRILRFSFERQAGNADWDFISSGGVPWESHSESCK